MPSPLPLLGWANFIATGVLSAAAEDAEAPASNLATDIGAEPFQTPAGTTAVNVDLDMGAGAVSRLFGVFRTNLTAAATVRFTLGTAQGAADVAGGDSGALALVVPGYGQAVWDAGADKVARWLRIAVSDPTNPDGRISLGLAFAGPAWQPSKGISLASTFGRERNATEVVTKGGQEYPILNWTRRVWSLVVKIMPEAETLDRLFELDRISAAGGNVLFVPDPAGTYLQREALFGRAGFSPLGFVGNRTRRNWSGQVTERL